MLSTPKFELQVKYMKDACWCLLMPAVTELLRLAMAQTPFIVCSRSILEQKWAKCVATAGNGTEQPWKIFENWDCRPMLSHVGWKLLNIRNHEPSWASQFVNSLHACAWEELMQDWAAAIVAVSFRVTPWTLGKKQMNTPHAFKAFHVPIDNVCICVRMYMYVYVIMYVYRIYNLLYYICSGHGQSGWYPIGCEGLYFHAMCKNRVSVSGWFPIGCDCFAQNLNIPCPLPSTLVFR